MTILDLLRLIKRYIVLVIALPVLCVLMTLLWLFFTQPTYTATASLITNGDLAYVQGLANKEIASYANSGITISSSSQSASKQVIVTATGSNADESINAANSVVSKTADEYQKINETVMVTATEAKSAKRNAPSPVRSCCAALLIGLALAIGIIVLRDMIKAPVKSREDAEHVCELPILGMANSAEEADRILANLEFCCDRCPSTTAVVPVGDAASAPVVSKELMGALKRSSVRSKLIKGSPYARKFKISVPDDAAVVVSCSPLAMGAGAAYIANKSDATILCVVAWKDSKRQLMSTIRELRLAKANVVGIAYLPENKDAKKASDAAKAAE